MLSQKIIARPPRLSWDTHWVCCHSCAPQWPFVDVWYDDMKGAFWVSTSLGTNFTQSERHAWSSHTADTHIQETVAVRAKLHAHSVAWIVPAPGDGRAFAFWQRRKERRSTHRCCLILYKVIHTRRNNFFVKHLFPTASVIGLRSALVLHGLTPARNWQELQYTLFIGYFHPKNILYT